MLRFITSLFAIFYVSFLCAAEIPDDLVKWQDWVKYQQEFRSCPSLNGQLAGNEKAHLCAWPGVLQLDVRDNQGSFEQRWKVIEESRVPLPGSLKYWPQEVVVNNQKATVLQTKNQPYLLLKKGDYQIRGKFFWNKRPESLRIPEAIALFDVSVNDKTQDFVSIKNNNLWLGSVKKTDIKEKDFIKLRVNRLIADGHPMTMTVVLDIEVSGRAREQKITRFSTQEYQLMRINAPLNTRIDSSGDLWMQLKPGEYETRLTFKIHGNNTEIQFKESGEGWPKQEIWVYQADGRLRSTQIEGLASIDAEQGFVGEWRRLPHYLVNADDTLKIIERQRGISHNFDSLSLDRQMWLSFDNQNYYFFDFITGNKSKDWRVNTIDGYRLTQLSNHEQQRLITLDEKKRTGAEIRTPKISIKASGEVPKDIMRHASGWDMPLSKTNVTLHIPPGRKLFNISGADSSHGDWLSRWSLIDLFFVLVIVALVFKVFGVAASGVALLTLVLGYHESNMPVFWWFNLVVALTLVLKVTSPKLKKLAGYYRWFSITLLALVMLPFLADQIRYTLYPQLELNRALSSEYPESRDLEYFAAEPTPETLRKPAPAIQSVPRVLQETVADEKQKITVTGSRIKRSDLDTSYESGAVIQAGKGRPSWHWQTASYSWNGVINGDEKVDIQIVPLYVVKFLRILLVVLSVLWLWLLFKVSRANKSSSENNNPVAGNTLAMLMALTFLVSAGAPNISNASEFPSDKLLKELQQRIYPAEKCHPDCVTLTEVQVEINNLQAKLNLRYFSQANKAGLLPMSSDWRVDEVRLNGRVVRQLWKNKQGVWLLLPSGEANIELVASLKDKSEVALRFAEKPKRIQLEKIVGWETSGVVEQTLRASELQLSRLVTKADNRSAAAESVTVATEQSISELFSIHRHFRFASQWSLLTKVSRLAPQVGTLTTKVALYDFERPLNQTENVKDGLMSVVIPSNENSVDWSSSISGQSSFEITAIDDRAKLETWELLVFPNWNLEVNGVPAVSPEHLSKDDYWVYLYYPRAGEKLSFTLTKPPTAEGDSVAISKVTQIHNVSKRKTTTSLNIDYRATRAEPLLLHIGDAELKKLEHDSRQINLGSVEGVVSVNLKPGKHKLFFELEQKTETSVKMDLLSPKLNKEFTNLTTRVALPDSRWLIGASGPGYGPAVIYWGELIFFILLAIGLSRMSFSPINYWQWLVLGLGMSTFSWPALALVAGWILGSEWRRQNQTIPRQYPILTSWLTLIATLIAVLVLVAAVPFGLLQSPDMGVVGNGSYGNQLNWFLDRGQSDLGQVTLISLPIWIYKGLMLLWATWLSFALIKWLGWTWKDLQGSQFLKRKTSSEAQTSGLKDNPSPSTQDQKEGI